VQHVYEYKETTMKATETCTRGHIDYAVESDNRTNWMDLTGGLANGGLTVLDYFAAKAMQALIEKFDESPAESADEAYDWAEAMLKERTARFTPANVVRGVTGRTYG